MNCLWICALQTARLTFAQSLFETGQLTVARLQTVDPAETSSWTSNQSVQSYLQSIERIWRGQCPGIPPNFLPDFAEQAVQALELFCQAIVHREVSVEQLKRNLDQLLATTPAQYDEPSVHYSVDIAYRFLPQIAERASRLEPNDPLISLLQEHLLRWPLSSVGAVSTELKLPVAIRHPSLWSMYIDRVIVHEDKTRLNEPSVKEAVATALGPHPFLAPQLANNVFSDTVKAPFEHD